MNILGDRSLVIKWSEEHPCIPSVFGKYKEFSRILGHYIVPGVLRQRTQLKAGSLAPSFVSLHTSDLDSRLQLRSGR